MKFTKHDSGKSRLDLLPPTALELVGLVARFGVIKYEENNYLTCKDHKRYIAPILRHVYKHLKGEFTDPESGQLHLAHAICSGLFALELFVNEEQNRKIGMERKQFSYFAVIERKSKKRGVVLKRFRTYIGAHAWLTKEELSVDTHIVKTVQPKNKVGQNITL